MMASQVPSHVVSDQGQAPNLWQQALDSLDSDLKNTMDFENSSKQEILKRTLETAIQKKQVCLNKRWKFERHGRQVIVRDLLQKIIKWIDRFKAVADVATQYDPSHASLPWAGIRFVLQIAISESKIFGSTIENLEIVSHVITRYAIFEDIHAQRTTSADAELRRSLIALYAQVLKFLAKAKKFFETPVAEEDKQMDAIKEKEIELSAIVSLSDTFVLNRLQDLEHPITRIADQLATYEKVQKTAQYREILNWLSPVNYSLHHTRVTDGLVPDVGKWLFSHTEYLKWLSSSESSMLLLHGPAGCGKTNLASIAIEHFKNALIGGNSSAPCAYFYCTKSKSEPARSNPSEILGSIVRQLSTNPSRKSVHVSISNRFETQKEASEGEGFEIERPKCKDCVELLLEVIASDPATVIIDGLDELPNMERYELINSLKLICDKSENVFKVLLTGRDERQILALLDDCQKIQIDAQLNRKDMKIFVQHYIRLTIKSRSLLGGQLSLELQEYLEHNIIYSAGERFLLAHLLLKKLCEEDYGDDEDAEIKVREAIRRLSRKTLENLYQEAYSAISAAKAKVCNIAKTTFALLLHSREPLTLNACLAAVKYAEINPIVELTMPELLKLCKNLVVADTHCNILRFVHPSAKEFLEMQTDMTVSQANGMIAFNCINMYMHGEMADPTLEIYPTKHFQDYSALYWAEHLRDADNIDETSTLRSLSRAFIFGSRGESSLSFRNWVTQAKRYSKALTHRYVLKRALETVSSPQFTPLFVACSFGLSWVVEALNLLTSFEWDQKNDEGHTALYLACVFGHGKIVELLLSNGSNPNIACGWFGNALQAACYEGNHTILKMLLKSGADPMTSGKFDHALEASIIGDNEDAALWILSQGFNIGTQETYDKVFLRAVQAGLVRVVQYMQQNYDSYSQSKSGLRNAIDSAILKGELPALKVMISHDSANVLPIDSVSTAALGGQNQVIAFLLEKGMDIEQSGEFGSPLRAASLIGHVSSVRMLLDRGADITASGPLGDALQAAATRGHVAVTKVLLDEGADPGASSGFYGNSLLAAAHQGHIDVVEALLDGGADPYRSGIFKNALHAAVEGDHENIIRLFLERGFSFRYPEEIGGRGAMRGPKPPFRDLLRATSPSHEKHDTNKASTSDVVTLAPSLGSDHIIPAQLRKKLKSIYTYKGGRYKRGRTRLANDDFLLWDALRIAASMGRTQMAITILDNWKSFSDEPFPDLDNTIHQASWAGHAKMVEILIDRKRHTTQGLTEALEKAMSESQQEVVSVLMEELSTQTPLNQLSSVTEKSSSTLKSRRIPGETNQNRDTFLAACTADDAKVAGALLKPLEEKCSIEEMLNIYQEALKKAAIHDSEKVLKLLLESVSFDASELNQTFMACCRHGHHRTAQILLESTATHSLGDSEFKDAIFSASKNSYLEILHILLEPPTIHTSIQDILDKSINIASQNGHADVVELLLCKNANPNAIFEEPTEEMLVRKSKHRQYRGLDSEEKILVSKGVSLMTTLDNWWPTHKDQNNASKLEKFFSLTLQHRADHMKSSEVLSSLLQIAVRYLSVEIVEELLNHGAPITLASNNTAASLNSDTAAWIASRSYENVYKEPNEVLAAYYGRSSSTDSQDKTITPTESLLALAAARELKTSKMVKVLLQAGAKLPVAKDTTNPVLVRALKFFEPQRENTQLWRIDGRFIESQSIDEILQSGPGACIKMLLELLPHEKTDSGSYDLLFQMAISAKDHAYIELLIRRGIDINSSGFYYGNPLQCAARIGDVHTVKSLLNLGAKVNKLGGRHKTALQAAIVGGHSKVVNLLLKSGGDIYLRERSNRNLLTKACALGNFTIVKLLFEYGAAVDAASATENMKTYKSYIRHWKASPLHMACHKGYKDIVTFLIDKGADMNLSIDTDRFYGFRSSTPLQMAVESGHVSIVRLLIERGVDIDRCYDYKTALTTASNRGQIHVVKILLQHGASIVLSKPRANALESACRSSRRKIVNLLLNQLAGTDQAQSACIGALLAAYRSRDDKIFQLLLRGVPYITPAFLTYACAVGLDDSVRELLDLGVDPDSYDGNMPRAIHVACFHQKRHIVGLLLQRNSDVSIETAQYGNPLQAALEGFIQYSTYFSSYESPSHRMSSKSTMFKRCWRLAPNCGFTDQIFTFGSNHPWVHAREKRDELLRLLKIGSSPLSQCESIVHLLLDNGVEVNPQYTNLGVPLHIASFMGNLSIIRRLLLHGAHFGTTCDRFGTALIAAIEGDQITAAELLLDNGADINFISSDHGSALHRACATNKYELVKMLLSRGADVNAIGGPYVTPFGAVVSSGLSDGCSDSEAIANLLLEQFDFRVQSQDICAAENIRGKKTRDTYVSLLQNRQNRHNSGGS